MTNFVERYKLNDKEINQKLNQFMNCDGVYKQNALYVIYLPFMNKLQISDELGGIIGLIAIIATANYCYQKFVKEPAAANELNKLKSLATNKNISICSAPIPTPFFIKDNKNSQPQYTFLIPESYAEQNPLPTNLAEQIDNTITIFCKNPATINNCEKPLNSKPLKPEFEKYLWERFISIEQTIIAKARIEQTFKNFNL